MTGNHIPVMAQAVLSHWVQAPTGRYIDATFGRGGHSQMLRSRAPKAQLLVLDRDEEAIRVAAQYQERDSHLHVYHGNFSEMTQAAQALGWSNCDGILLDLGVSSPQLDDPSRGFSFRTQGPLDMRMDTTKGISAAQWLAEVSEADLITALSASGERFAKRIARAIVTTRAQMPLTTTQELVTLITTAMPFISRHKHPATRTFQAIRLAVNEELEHLSQTLPLATKLLAPGAKLVVLSFHSGEDRLVKRYMQQLCHPTRYLPRHFPPPQSMLEAPRFKMYKQKPTQAECACNPRARSAILRVLEKIPMSE